MSDENRRLIAGCGYLGHRVARTWTASHIETHAITRSTKRAADFRAQSLTPVLLDLAAPPKDIQLPAADVVLWSVGYDRSAGIPRERTWIDGLRWLVQNLPTAPAKFFYVSSTSVYGVGTGEEINETAETNPATEGGQCCVAAEQMLRQLLRDRFPDTQLSVLRLAGIYGPNRLLRKVNDLRSGTPMPGDPGAWLNLIHVDDAVRMINALCTMDQLPPVVNVVNANTVTRRQYYSHLANQVNASSPVFGDSPASQRTRGGNKRIVSHVRKDISVQFLFDDISTGVADAVNRTPELPRE